MNYDETWVGLGVKSGGMLLIIGYESISGGFFNLSKTSDKHTFSIKSARIGLGLGGGADATAICVFQTKNIYQLNGKRIEDWGVNIDISKARLKDAAKIVKMQKTLQALKLAHSLGKITNNIKEIREAMSFLYTTFEIASSSGPAVHTLDIPFAGGGLELSAFKTVGTLQIDGIKIPVNPTGSRRNPDREIGNRI
jgi:hypothetical protein